MFLAVPVYLVVDLNKGIDALCGKKYSYLTLTFIVSTAVDCVCVLILLIALSDLLYKGELN